MKLTRETYYLEKSSTLRSHEIWFTLSLTTSFNDKLSNYKSRFAINYGYHLSFLFDFTF